MFLRGGMYDVFKAGAYLNDIPHTFSSTAYTPYNGSGGNTLTATFPLTVPGRSADRWNASRWATTAATRAATSNGRRTARGTSASTATR